MRILITGGLGQLGQALQKVLSNHDLVIVDLPEVDITERHSIETSLLKAKADLVIHCAALTDVELCAREPELAFKVNALGTQNVVLACKKYDVDLVHLSTNEVFAGDNPAGYEEWMSPGPINPYGKSKAAAEFYVRDLLSRYYIVRTAWLYAPGGGNFIHAILRKAREEGRLRVVPDEIGNPTNVNDLAQAVAELIETDHYGIFHLTNEGACSRWAFANEILRLADLEHIPNLPILSQSYKRYSTPPKYGALLNVTGAAIGIRLRPWQEALADYVSAYC